MTDAELDAMIADLRSPDTELFDVADAISALREKVAAKDREVAAIRELMNVYNLGGWTDAIAPMKRALAAEAENAALRQAISKVEENLSKWANDGSRPDEWLLSEWAGILNAALLAGKEKP